MEKKLRWWCITNLIMNFHKDWMLFWSSVKFIYYFQNFDQSMILLNLLLRTEFQYVWSRRNIQTKWTMLIGSFRTWNIMITAENETNTMREQLQADNYLWKRYMFFKIWLVAGKLLLCWSLKYIEASIWMDTIIIVIYCRLISISEIYTIFLKNSVNW